MGAGKSVVGLRLAKQIGWDFVDLDAEIVRIAGKSIADVFAESGEARFREIEHAALVEALKREQAVLALGGGTIESPGNRRLLLDDPRVLLVYLKAPLEVLLQRCAQQHQAQKDAPRRPVLEQRAELNARFLRRKPLYETAHVAIATADCDVDEVVRRLMNEWKRRTQIEAVR
jgi:shikimate kinase